MGRPRIYEHPGDAVRAWKLRNPERHAEQNRRAARAWKERNPDKVAAMREAQRCGYGLTVEELRAMAVAQENRCAICRVEPQETLHVDHDHDTGRVRGLLCRRCNVGIGMLGDDVELLRRALEYLERSR